MAVNWNRFRRRPSIIPVPISAKTRVASISEHRIEVGSLRRFAIGRWAQIGSFRPRVLIGCIADLQSLAALSDAGSLDLDSVDTAVLVATDLYSPPVSDTERVVLWQAFGVPVYEIVVGPDRRLLGSECEAHEGWHLDPHAKRYQKLFHDAEITTETCACGRKEPRVIMLKRKQPVAVLAATA